jgi:hypothetical protein
LNSIRSFSVPFEILRMIVFWVTGTSNIKYINLYFQC